MSEARQASQTQRAEIVTRLGSRCVYCKTQPYQHFDHVVPWSRWGNSSQSNLVPCCDLCGQRKGDKDPIEWLKDRCPPWLRTMTMRERARIAQMLEQRAEAGLYAGEKRPPKAKFPQPTEDSSLPMPIPTAPPPGPWTWGPGPGGPGGRTRVRVQRDPDD